MPTGVTLLNLRNALKSHIGASLVASNTADDARLNQLLSDKQVYFAAAYDWPQLKEHNQDVAMVGGTRFYNVSSIDFQRPHKCQIQWNTFWQGLTYGINEDDYNIINSEEGQVQDPVQKWQLYGIEPQSSTQKVEVWPVPAGSPQVLRFSGQKLLGSLAVDADTCDLDSLLLVLDVAADELTRKESPDANIKRQQAAQRMAQLRAIGPNRDSQFRIGSGVPISGRNVRYRRVLVGP